MVVSKGDRPLVKEEFALSLRRAALWGCSNLPNPFLRTLPQVFGSMFFVVQSRHRVGVRDNLALLGHPSDWRAQWKTFVSFAESFSEGLASLGP